MDDCPRLGKFRYRYRLPSVSTGGDDEREDRERKREKREGKRREGAADGE